MNIDFWYRVNLDKVVHSNDWQILNSHEKIQAEKFTNPLLQQRYVTVHSRLRSILAQYLNESPSSIYIQKTTHGKPYLVDYPDLAFNLSHTRDYMAVAIAKNCQLGVDIELCKQRASLAALVRKCFSEEEIIYWQQLSEAQQQREFYQFWTRKEAFVKASGFGIAVGLRECVINPKQPARFLAVPVICGVANSWHSRDIDLGQAICAAVVANKAIASISFFT